MPSVCRAIGSPRPSVNEAAQILKLTFPKEALMKSRGFISVVVGAMVLALPLVGCATYAQADQLSVPAGPFGGCPPGYWLGRAGQACWIKQVRPGPYGGCPPDYHLGPQGGWCWANFVD